MPKCIALKSDPCNRIKIHVLDTYILKQKHWFAVPEHVEVASVYLLEGDLDQPAIERLIEDLLCDPVTENAVVGLHQWREQSSSASSSWGHRSRRPRRWNLPPNVCWALRQCSHRYPLRLCVHDPAAAGRPPALANEVIQEVHDATLHPEAFSRAPRNLKSVKWRWS